MKLWMSTIRCLLFNFDSSVSVGRAPMFCFLSGFWKENPSECTKNTRLFNGRPERQHHPRNGAFALLFLLSRAARRVEPDRVAKTNVDNRPETRRSLHRANCTPQSCGGLRGSRAKAIANAPESLRRPEKRRWHGVTCNPGAHAQKQIYQLKIINQKERETHRLPSRHLFSLGHRPLRLRAGFQGEPRYSNESERIRVHGELNQCRQINNQ